MNTKHISYSAEDNSPTKLVAYTAAVITGLALALLAVFGWLTGSSFVALLSGTVSAAMPVAVLQCWYETQSSEQAGDGGPVR